MANPVVQFRRNRRGAIEWRGESTRFDWEETSAESLDEALKRVRSQSTCRMEWVSIFGQIFPIASDPQHPERPLLKSAKAAGRGAGGS